MSCCTVIMPYCTELPSHVLLCRSTLCCTVLFRVLFCLVILCLAMPSRFFALYCGGSRPILFIYVVSLFLCRFVYSSSLKRAVSSKQLLLMFIYVCIPLFVTLYCVLEAGENMPVRKMPTFQVSQRDVGSIFLTSHNT